MTKPQYQRVEKFIARRARVWQKRLGLAHFEIEHVFLDAWHADDSTDGTSTPAECKPSWQYLRATIEWNLPSIVSHSETAVEKIIVHELAHVLLAPEQENLKASQAAAMELSTEMVARALWRAWE